MAVNRLILGDNLEILKSMENDGVDLIYLDPPFFSNRNYIDWFSVKIILEVKLLGNNITHIVMQEKTSCSKR